jgi:hypothetical protein
MDINSKLAKNVFALLKEGEEHRRTGKEPTHYPGQSLEHCLQVYGWVREDLRQHLIANNPAYAANQRRAFPEQFNG